MCIGLVVWVYQQVSVEFVYLQVYVFVCDMCFVGVGQGDVLWIELMFCFKYMCGQCVWCIIVQDGYGSLVDDWIIIYFRVYIVYSVFMDVDVGFQCMFMGVKFFEGWQQ